MDDEPHSEEDTVGGDPKHAPAQPSVADGVAPDIGDMQVEPTPADPPSRWRRLVRHRRVLMAVGVALVASSLVGFGFGLGWTVATRQTKPVTETVTVEVPVPDYDSDGAVQMPDVRGLAQAEAQAVIADAGIPATQVAVTSKPAAGVAGIVVDQTPLFGTENPSAIQLLVSAPAVVPELVGQAEREATETLLALGARVERATRYVPGTAPGVVVEVQPAAGAPLGESVTLTISEPASSVYLTQVERIAGSCSSAQESLNGKDFPESMKCAAGAKPQLSEWLLDRAGTDLIATLGVPDSGASDAAVRVRVLADGNEVGSFTAAYGQATDIKVPVAGALRLGIEVTAVNMPERTSASWYAVLGDARVEGSAAALEQLTERS